MRPWLTLSLVLENNEVKSSQGAVISFLVYLLVEHFSCLLLELLQRSGELKALPNGIVSESTEGKLRCDIANLLTMPTCIMAAYDKGSQYLRSEGRARSYYSIFRALERYQSIPKYDIGKQARVD